MIWEGWKIWSRVKYFVRYSRPAYLVCKKKNVFSTETIHIICFFTKLSPVTVKPPFFLTRTSNNQKNENQYLTTKVDIKHK